MPAVQLQSVKHDDFEAMLALRIEALRESLERLGRFDPEVARARLKSQFSPDWMKHLVMDGERVGYFTLVPRDQSLHLQHLYLRPAWQGRGVGGWVIEHIKARARAEGKPITLGALRGSRANAFYLRHGFQVDRELEVDIEYRWEPQA
ncbi:GNAT family N-acetyltransferase [Roseateles cellulosilyticus]|uniref:GNAT family N-acetyltransferase n=1 Tax=Pelomonas cellulosilytica TaxID=2906762 RepID=A0ABS8XTT4_9BURK|nr:GNAT family N-acetyltransferase [Pelomonas sp. P8]MCE4556097.1 GNAT family N-acetyltransferase [Pelomonas sp. P8]